MSSLDFIDQNKELYELTRKQAIDLLNAYLLSERTVLASFKIDSVVLDYSLDSICKFYLEIVANRIKNNKQSTQSNRLWVCRAAYYFGETLCRNYNHLGWSVGKPDFAHANHPVVTGFKGGIEAAVITISRNVIDAVVIDGEPFERIENAVNFWLDAAAKR